MVLFYGYKFLKMGMQGKCMHFYSYGSFLWLQIFKNGYTGEWEFFFCLKFKSLSEVGPKHTTAWIFTLKVA